MRLALPALLALPLLATGCPGRRATAEDCARILEHARQVPNSVV